MREQIEMELNWRQDEIFFFKNIVNNISEEQREKYRKSLVLILYSHLEGYVKICLQTYVGFINKLKLSCRDVKTELAVSSLRKEFNNYENIDRKYNKKTGEDKEFNRFSIQVEFLNSIHGYLDKKLFIPDEVINTESNLHYDVLQKNLHRVGLSDNQFAEYKNDINALVNRRNAIAHGSSKSGVSEEEYLKWEKSARVVMEAFPRILYDCAINKNWLVND